MGALAAVVKGKERPMKIRWSSMRWWSLAGLLVSVALLTGCAGQNPLIGTAGRSGVAGFWSGVWHGIICPIAFAISLFNHAYSIYEVHNRGHWYDFGFILGAGAWGILRGRGSDRH